MQMSHVDIYYAKKTPFYSRMSPRGQITIPKVLRDFWQFDSHQFVKLSIVETGILLEPVVGIVPRNKNQDDIDSEEKDPELVKAERADLDDMYNRLMR